MVDENTEELYTDSIKRAAHELLELHRLTMLLFNLEDASWETKFEIGFKMSKQVHACLDTLGLSLEYYDPDTTYEEDFKAYVNAFDKKVQELLPWLTQITANLQTAV